MALVILKHYSIVSWTDSTTVLKYICNETISFHTFVAHRVSVIRKATKVDQWKYVGSKLNPADEGSHGLRVEDGLKAHSCSICQRRSGLYLT